MRTKHLILLFFLFFQQTGTLLAQDPCHEWSHGWGHNAQTSVVTSDDSGNVYVAVSFNYTVDFDPSSSVYNLTSFPGGTFPRQDIAVIKLDSNNSIVWIKQITGNASGKTASDIVIKNGYIYITGKIGGSFTDMDPSNNIANNTGNHSAGFLTKWTVDGEYEWSLRFESDFSAYYQLYDEALSVDIDNQENVIVSGYFVDSMDIDPDTNNTFFLYGEYLPDDETGFVAKYNSSGDLLWGYSLASNLPNEAKSVATDSIGNVYVTGRFEGSTDFDPDTTQYILTSDPVYADIFIQKVSPNGEFIWAHQIGTSESEVAVEIEVEPNGGFYIFGMFAATLDLDPSLATANVQAVGEHDCFIAHYDSSAAYVWSKSYGGPGYDATSEMKRDDVGNFYLTGTFQDSVEFDPNSGSFMATNGTASAYVLKLTDQGVFEWVTTYANQYYTKSHSLTVTPSLDVYLVGWSENGTLDMDPGLGTMLLSGKQSFIHKLKQCNIQYVTDSVSTCDQYYWPYSGNQYNQTGQFIEVGEDVTGCDSVVTLNLQVNYSTSSLTNDTSCDSYTWAANNTTFNASGTYIDTIQNLGGCDSVVTLELIIQNSDSVSSSTSACQEYFWNTTGVMYTISGTYDTIFSNVSGCDSSMTLHLNIHPLDTTVTQNGNTLIASPNQHYQWLRCDSNSFEVLENDTNMTLTPTENGYYSVIVINDPCLDTTSCFEVTAVGVQDEPNGEKVKVLQHASGLNLVLVGGNAGFDRVSIWNTLGQQLDELAGFNKRIMQLESPQASGIYFVRCELSNGKVLVKKVFLNQ